MLTKYLNKCILKQNVFKSKRIQFKIKVVVQSGDYKLPIKMRLVLLDFQKHELACFVPKLFHTFFG